MMRAKWSLACTCSALALALLAASPDPAEAQTATAPTLAISPGSGEPGRGGSLELSAGGALLTPQSLGTVTATMTSNNTTGSRYNYFSVNGTRSVAPAFHGTVGYNITSMFTVEGGLTISRGNVQASVSNDAEGAAGVTAAEQMTQYFVDAALRVNLRHLAFAGGAGVPFVEGGAGYLRQMHEGNFVRQTGQIYHFGGGITYMFSRRPASRLSGMGVRADARVYVPRSSYVFTASQQVFAGVGAALVLAF